LKKCLLLGPFEEIDVFYFFETSQKKRVCSGLKKGSFKKIKNMKE
jgi:hypothetical protein